LIETVIIYKLPRLGRQEIQTMLQVRDIRETRVYQEAREEGLQEGLQRGIEKGMKKGRRDEKLKLIRKMAARNMSAAEIADILELDVKLVRKTMRKPG
jgi:predicted transposase/invertase (TIGR01784 family)